MSKYAVNLILNFPSETIKVSNVANQDDQGNFSPLLDDISAIQKSVNFADGYRSEPVTIKIVDNQNRFKDILKNPTDRRIEGSLVSIQFKNLQTGSIVWDISSWVTSKSYKEGVLTLECKTEPPFMEEEYPKDNLSRDIFPDLPEVDVDRAMPYRYGMQNSPGGDYPGAVRCPLAQNGNEYLITKGHIHILDGAGNRTYAGWDGGEPLLFQKDYFVKNGWGAIDGEKYAFAVYAYEINPDIEGDAPPEDIFLNIHGIIEGNDPMEQDWLWHPVGALQNFHDGMGIPYDSDSFDAVKQALMDGDFYINLSIEERWRYKELITEFSKNFFLDWRINDPGEVVLIKKPVLSDDAAWTFRNEVDVFPIEYTGDIVNKLEFKYNYLDSDNLFMFTGIVSNPLSIEAHGEHTSSPLELRMAIGGNIIDGLYRERALEIALKHLKNRCWYKDSYTMHFANIDHYISCGVHLGDVIQGEHDDMASPDSAKFQVIGETRDLLNETVSIEIEEITAV